MNSHITLTDLELLALWRRAPAGEVLRSDPGLTAAALRRCALADPVLGKVLDGFEHRLLPGRDIAGYGFSLIEEAHSGASSPASPLLLDAGASCHVLAAQHDYATSNLVLAQLLADGNFMKLVACRTNWDTNQEYDRLARSWAVDLLRRRKLARMSKLYKADDLSELEGLCFVHRAFAFGGGIVSDRDRKAPADAWSGRDGTTVRVIEAKPDVPTLEGTKDGGRLRRQYDVLFKPLALGGIGLNGRALVAALRLEFPWLAEAIDAIEDQVALNALTGRPGFRLRPLLLVGPPGAGKTRFARRLAHLAGTGVAEITGAGSSDNRMLQGTASGWSSAQPAFPLVVMARHRVANPVIVVDEVDKGSDSRRNGRLTDTLLAMLEPETARAWFDEALLETADLSHVSWVLTANDASGLPRPLLSRLTVVGTGKPQPEHFDRLLAGIRAELAADHGLPADDLPELMPEVQAALRQAFEEGTDIRTLKRAVIRALARGGERRVLH